MASVEVLNWEKKKVGQVDLNPAVFEKEPRTDIMHTVVRWQLACRRKGTHKAKTRAEVRGGGSKPFRQKGTGNARQGSIRSPLMEAGGVIFPPKPRDYSYTLPKKTRQAGLRSALAYLFKQGRLFVVDSMGSPEGKTKELASRLNGFGVNKAVLVGAEVDEKFSRAAQNLPSYVYYEAQAANVYDLLKYDAVIMTEEALKQLEARCGVRS